MTVKPPTTTTTQCTAFIAALPLLHLKILPALQGTVSEGTRANVAGENKVS